MDAPFKPENITDGGIRYDFIAGDGLKVVSFEGFPITWPRLDDEVMTSWAASENILAPKNGVLQTPFKSLEGAPVFTLDELNLWRGCCYRIG